MYKEALQRLIHIHFILGTMFPNGVIVPISRINYLLLKESAERILFSITKERILSAVPSPAWDISRDLKMAFGQENIDGLKPNSSKSSQEQIPTLFSQISPQWVVLDYEFYYDSSSEEEENVEVRKLDITTGTGKTWNAMAALILV